MGRCQRCYATLVRDIHDAPICLMCGSGRFRRDEPSFRGAIKRLARRLRLFDVTRVARGR